MATSTTNLGLIKPAGTDKIRIAQINQNMDTLDAAVGAVGATSLQAQVNALGDGLAIVANGDSHIAISAGQYVYVKNNTHSLNEGLYVASAAVSANGAITSSNMTADDDGGLNALNANITDLKRYSVSGYVDLSSYTSSDNKYTFQYDGYIVLNTRANTTGYIGITITMGSTDITEQMYIRSQYETRMIFVKKGMKVYVNHSESGAYTLFYPLNA